MQMLSAAPTILASGVAQPSGWAFLPSAGRSIALEGIAVRERAQDLLRSSALVLLIVILAD
jgi:hypothetical protein